MNKELDKVLSFPFDNLELSMEDLIGSYSKHSSKEEPEDMFDQMLKESTHDPYIVLNPFESSSPINEFGVGYLQPLPEGALDQKFPEIIQKKYQVEELQDQLELVTESLEISESPIGTYQSISEEESISFCLSQCSEKRPPPKKGPKKKKSSPQHSNNLIKNILPNFMAIILDFIQRKAQSFLISEAAMYKVAKIQKKKVNKDLFVELFQIEELRPVIEHMFNVREIQRAVQIGRTKVQLRCAYVAKVGVFRQAFLTKKFPRIK